MAVGNMIVTLVAQTKKWSSGLQKAARDTTSFGSFAQRGFGLAAGALASLTYSLFRAIPMLAQMGAESRKADIQLKFMIENMDGAGKATDEAVKQMALYAKRVSIATGIDDEQIKAVQRKMLMFKSVRKTADEMGGSFDRATKAAIDLAAGGFGSMETNAIKLGKMLESPTANLNALNRAGVVFTDAEKRKIQLLDESGRKYEAQDFILGKIEGRVKGLAEASSTPFERMQQQFRQIGDKIGTAMLPNLEEMNKQIGRWLSSRQGKQDLKDIVQGFVDLSGAIKDSAIFAKDFFEWMSKSKTFIRNLLDTPIDQLGNLFRPDGWNTHQGGGGGGGVGGGNGRHPSPTLTPIINFNAPIDSVSAGREVSRVLADYQRAAGRRA